MSNKNNNEVLNIDEIEKFAFSFSSIGSWFEDEKNNKETLLNKFSKEEIRVERRKAKINIDDKEITLSGNLSFVELDNEVIVGIRYSIPPFLERVEYYKNLAEKLKLRAYLYMKSSGLDYIKIICQGKELELVFMNEVEEHFDNLIKNYLNWRELREKWESIRNESLEKVTFPFPEYRIGQEQFMRDIYRIIYNKKKCIAQAPTGTGKTLSTLFPTITSMSKGLTDKVYYLTAKTVGVKVAEESIQLMREKGLKIKNVIVTAKEKVCKNEEVSCNTQKCQYAINHYGKSKLAIMDLFLNEDNYTRDCIDKYAEKYKVCPYELSLQLSTICDVIIADYNYVFDFGVNHKLFPDGQSKKSKNVFLVDEAHNLVDRARNMFSAHLDKGRMLEASRELNPFMDFGSDSFQKVLHEIEIVEENKKYFEPNDLGIPKGLIKAIKELHNEVSTALKSASERFPMATALDLVSSLDKFIFVSSLYDKNSTFYLERRYTTIKDCRFKIFCINPSENLKKSYENANSVVLFSATFSPLNYFFKLLGGDKDMKVIKIDNPFPKENKKILIADNISTRLKHRENSYSLVCEQIEAAVSCKMGNYMVFVSSFEYLEKLYAEFKLRNPEINTIKQVQGMNEEERELYLNNFTEAPSETLVSFNVVSGLFAEGIDLKGDRLIGSIIVGPALPTFDTESQIIQNYFNREKVNGYDIAYTFPGFNRVLQAAGRVIRTNEDKGIIMLIDDRFNTNTYKNIFPIDWDEHIISKSKDETIESLSSFWNN